VVFFKEREIARFATLEQAEWRAKELNEWSERNPRGYIQYSVKPVEEHRIDQD
jgi:tRNA(Ile)-lysidine synthase TilS/MesJ